MPQELSIREISDAFEKTKIKPEMGSPIKENSYSLNNALKTMIWTA